MIKNVWIEEGCVTCGNSESVCPEVFEIDIEKEDTLTILEKYVDDIEINAPKNKLKELMKVLYTEAHDYI